MAVLIAGCGPGPAPANAADSGRLLTLVARQVDTFAEITGRARNNIQETSSARADSPYGNPAVRPRCRTSSRRRSRASISRLRPITAWEFTTAGLTPCARSPSRGSARSPSSRTRSSGRSRRKARIPLLDEQGADTGEQIQGAVTTSSTPTRSSSQQGQRQLSIQGGSPTNPITDADNYWLAARRCATDNLTATTATGSPTRRARGTRSVTPTSQAATADGGQDRHQEGAHAEQRADDGLPVREQRVVHGRQPLHARAERELVGLTSLSAPPADVELRGTRPRVRQRGSEAHLRLLRRQQHVDRRPLQPGEGLGPARCG